MDTHVRKSSYGRTELFLPSRSTILREVKCMGGVEQHGYANVYHLLPDLSDVDITKLSCWHCCEPFIKNDVIFKIPQVYDHVQNVYYVYGATCGPECAKAYIIEHSTFDRSKNIVTLTKMLQCVYSINTPIVETPPRSMLLRFGGTFDPKRKRRTVCTLVTPPFVSYCMIVKECGFDFEVHNNSLQLDSHIEDEFDDPPLPPLFGSYLQGRGNNVNVKTCTKRRRANSEVKGPLAQFVR